MSVKPGPVDGQDEAVTDLLACPCCGYRTLPERDNYELCPVCFWEDDPSESRAPGFAGGANSVDLVTAHQTFLRIGAMHPLLILPVRNPVHHLVLRAADECVGR